MKSEGSLAERFSAPDAVVVRGHAVAGLESMSYSSTDSLLFASDCLRYLGPASTTLSDLQNIIFNIYNIRISVIPPFSLEVPEQGRHGVLLGLGR